MWFTAREIAHLRGLSYGYVLNLASAHQWRRLGSRPQRYHIHDVMTTFKSAKFAQT